MNTTLYTLSCDLIRRAVKDLEVPFMSYQNSNGSMFYHKADWIEYNDCTPQELMVVIKRDIKVGDVCISRTNNTRFDFIPFRYIENLESGEGLIKVKMLDNGEEITTTANLLNDAFTIIASSNKKVGVSSIKESSITKYVNEFNKGNVLEKAVVQFEKDDDRDGSYWDVAKPVLNEENEISITFLN